MESSKQEMKFFKQEMELFHPLPDLWSKTYFQNVSHFNQGVHNWISKQEIELSKQEMELFIPFSGLWSKNSFYEKFLIFTEVLKIDF